MSDDSSSSSESQTKSHSELFGLDPNNNSETKGHKEPGSVISGTQDMTKGKDDAPGPAASGGDDSTKVGGIAQADSDSSERPG
eukprot:c43932_g1_i1 orf=2-247(-)